MNNAVEINPSSRDWKVVEEWAEKRLADYRIRNDSPVFDDRATAMLRGRIGELKELLALAKPLTPNVPDGMPGTGESE